MRPRKLNKDYDASLSLYRTIKRLQQSGAAGETIRAEVHDYVKGGMARHRDFIRDLRRSSSLVRMAPAETLRIIAPEFLRGLGVMSSERLVVSSRRAGVPIDSVVSFTAAMNRRAYQKQKLKGKNVIPENRLLSKTGGYEFAKTLGAKVPRQSDVFPLSGFIPSNGVAVKPANGEGSRGVYLIHDEENIRDVKTGENIRGFENLKADMTELVSSGVVREDSWVLEEIVYEDRSSRVAGRDFKFHCFYGECLLVLEVVRDSGGGYNWWTPTGERAVIGRHGGETFESDGVPDDYLELAKWLSTQIPAPFMRIDIMQSYDGPVLGEFTGHPGGYEQFGAKWDVFLGMAFAEAEVRLTSDLLNGKKFPQFVQ